MYREIEKRVTGQKTAGGQWLFVKVMRIVCDTEAEIPAVKEEWDTGSECIVLENGGCIWYLSNARTWVKTNFHRQGEGSGTFDPDDYYDKPQTDARIAGKIAEIIANAPEDFDTLKEISDWISSHEDSAAAMNTAIQGKVDKITGKSLSTNDYTTAEKNKLEGLQNYDDSALQAAVTASNLLNFITQSGALESGDNLDNYGATEGFYNSPTGTVTQSLLNKPSDVGYSGKLLVKKIGSTYYQLWLSQSLDHVDAAGNRTGIYIRSYVLGTFSAWYKIL